MAWQILITTTLRRLAEAFKFTRSFWPSSHYALLALLFIVGLELIFALQRWVIIVSTAVVAVVTVGIILARAEEKRSFSFEQIILPVFAALGLTGFASLLPTTWALHVYIVMAGLLLFFLLKHGTRQVYPIWNWTITLIIYFLNIAFITSLRFHVDAPVLLALTVVLVVTGLMSWQALRRIARDTDVVLPALAMAFVHAEVAWVIQFLPAHYTTQTGILTTLYYVLFNLISTSFKRQLTKRDFIEYATIGSAALIILVFSTQWT